MVSIKCLPLGTIAYLKALKIYFERNFDGSANIFFYKSTLPGFKSVTSRA